MLRNLKLKRPLAVFDVETTGKNPEKDRIVELSVLRILPSGKREQRTRRLNPRIPISESATAIHGITDADVAKKPTFKQIASSLDEFLEGCDLCGYNLKRFDLKVLIAEFARAGIAFGIEGRAILDPLEIYFFYEPRDLSAAAKFYLGVEHKDSHSAKADVDVTIRVLDAMLARYPDLPRKVAELDERFRDPNALDFTGNFRLAEGRVVFAFGKYQGSSLEEVSRNDPAYLKWILQSDFGEETKAVVLRELRGAGRTPNKTD